MEQRLPEESLMLGNVPSSLLWDELKLHNYMHFCWGKIASVPQKGSPYIILVQETSAHLGADILKCGFGCLSGMVRSTDQIVNISEWIVTLISQQERACHTTQGRVGKPQGQAAGRGSRRKRWTRPSLWFLQEGMGEAVQAALELACLSNFSGHRGVGSISRCP